MKRVAMLLLCATLSACAGLTHPKSQRMAAPWTLRRSASTCSTAAG